MLTFVTKSIYSEIEKKNMFLYKYKKKQKELYKMSIVSNIKNMWANAVNNADALQNGTASTSSNSTTDPRMSMNGSIFGNISLNGGSSNTITVGSSNNKSSERQDLLKNANNAQSDSSDSNMNASNATSQSQDLSTQAKGFVSQNKSEAMKVQAKTAIGVGKIRQNNSKINQENKENQRINDEIQDLQEQMEEAQGADSTGAKENSAFSLKGFDSKPAATTNGASGKGKTKKAANEQNEENSKAQNKDDNSSKADGIQSEIDSKKSEVAVNNNVIKSTTSSTTSTMTTLNTLFNQASKIQAKTTSTTAAGQEKASVAA